MQEASSIVGLICAAGVGSRMQLGMPKQYLKMAGLPMLVHTCLLYTSPSPRD